MDVLATYLAMNAALEQMRSGAGPTLVEAEVYRYFHQNGPFPGSAFGYRTKEEEQAWRERDPLRSAVVAAAAAFDPFRAGSGWDRRASQDA